MCMSVFPAARATRGSKVGPYRARLRPVQLAFGDSVAPSGAEICGERDNPRVVLSHKRILVENHFRPVNPV